MAYPSTYTDLQNEVIAKIRLDSTNDLQKAKDWINRVYRETCVETEALQTFATMALTASQNIYTLDTSIGRIKQMYVTPVGSTASYPLEPVSIEEMITLNAGTAASNPNTGGPNRYAVFGINDIQFYPTPTSADTVTIYYVKFPTALSAGTDVPAIPEPYATECLVNGACYHAAIFAGDPQAQAYRQDYETAKARLRGHLRRFQGSYTRQFRTVPPQNRAPHDPSVDPWPTR